jgi:antitoxin CptB
MSLPDLRRESQMGEGERATQTGVAELNRLRWQCRRGLLELDLVLERFLERHGDQLQGETLASFKTLLDYSDNDLLDLIRARTECTDSRLADVLGWMRKS